MPTVGNDCNCLPGIFTDNSLNWDKHKKNCFQGGDPFNLMRQLTIDPNVRVQ